MKCLLRVDGQTFKTMDRPNYGCGPAHVLYLAVRNKLSCAMFHLDDKPLHHPVLHKMEFELVDYGRDFAIYDFVGITE